MKGFYLIFITISLLLASCQNKVCNCVIDPEIVYRSDSALAVNTNKYADEYAKYWEQYDEPGMHESKEESYRLSISVLLDYYYKIYRIEKKGKNAKLWVKEYALYAPSANRRQDSLVRDTTRILTDLEWNHLVDIIDKNCFWTITHDIEKRVLDGSSWRLEGFHPRGNDCTKSKYHSAWRASPDSSQFTNIANYIMELDTFRSKEF